MDLELRFGRDVIGVVKGAFHSDWTWYGVFQPADTGVPGRVREYIDFCREWHERLRADCPHSAAEFDAYRDIYASTLWRVCGPGNVDRAVEGPVFIETEITWRDREES